MNEPLLEVQDLSVSYGKIEAVRDVSIVLQAGRIVTVIGPNGAGKSTLLNCIMGLLPGRGTIRLDGVDQSSRRTEERVGAGLGLVAERRELFGSMSVEDNLLLGGYQRKRGELTQAMSAMFDRFPRLKERRQQLAATLSGGERQMLAMARGLMTGPRVLMLDEPSLGLAPRIVQETLRIVRDLRSTGVAVLLVEQNARAALEIADYGYVMSLGEVTQQGPAKDLLKDPAIIEIYFGSHQH